MCGSLSPGWSGKNGVHNGVTQELSVDAAGVGNADDHSRGSENRLDFGTAPSYLQGLSMLDNSSHGLIYGAELAMTWQTVACGQFRELSLMIQSDLEKAASGPGFGSPCHQASSKLLNLARVVNCEEAGGHPFP